MCKWVNVRGASRHVCGEAPNARTWFPSLATRGQTEEFLSRVKNATDHHAQASFISPSPSPHPHFCHGCRRQAKQSPGVSMVNPGPRGREKSHYICCHTKSLSRCGGERERHTSPDALPDTQKYLTCLISACGEKTRPPL